MGGLVLEYYYCVSISVMRDYYYYYYYFGRLTIKMMLEIWVLVEKRCEIKVVAFGVVYVIYVFLCRFMF